MITFKKFNSNGTPEIIADRIISWTKDNIEIDDTGLTAIQIAFLKYWMYERGFKQQ